MIKFVIPFFLLLSACATEAQYQKNLNSWLGSTESELVEKWGPPDQVYELEGKKYLTYIYSNSNYVPQTVNSNVIGNSVQTQVYGGYTQHWYCKTIMTIENKEITNWKYEGNACRAY